MTTSNFDAAGFWSSNRIVPLKSEKIPEASLLEKPIEYPVAICQFCAAIKVKALPVRIRKAATGYKYLFMSIFFKRSGSRKTREPDK